MAVCRNRTRPARKEGAPKVRKVPNALMFLRRMGKHSPQAGNEVRTDNFYRPRSIGVYTFGHLPWIRRRNFSSAIVRTQGLIHLEHNVRFLEEIMARSSTFFEGELRRLGVRRSTYNPAHILGYSFQTRHVFYDPYKMQHSTWTEH